MQSLKGTPSFWSPEMLVYHEYTEKADIWALGVTFYYLMNLTYPYDGNNLFELSANIFLDIREKSTKNNNNYSEKFVLLIEKMLSRKAEDRPSAEMILKEGIIQEYMSPFLTDNKFDSGKASNFIKKYEEQNKQRNEMVKQNKQEITFFDRELIIKDVMEKNSFEKYINSDYESKKQIEENEKEKLEKEKYEMNKIMSKVNEINKITN